MDIIGNILISTLLGSLLSLNIMILINPKSPISYVFMKKYDYNTILYIGNKIALLCGILATCITFYFIHK